MMPINSAELVKFFDREKEHKQQLSCTEIIKGLHHICDCLDSVQIPRSLLSQA